MIDFTEFDKAVRIPNKLDEQTELDQAYAEGVVATIELAHELIKSDGNIAALEKVKDRIDYEAKTCDFQAKNGTNETARGMAMGLRFALEEISKIEAEPELTIPHWVANWLLDVYPSGYLTSLLIDVENPDSGYYDDKEAYERILEYCTNDDGTTNYNHLNALAAYLNPLTRKFVKVVDDEADT